MKVFSFAAFMWKVWTHVAFIGRSYSRLESTHSCFTKERGNT